MLLISSSSYPQPHTYHSLFNYRITVLIYYQKCPNFTPLCLCVIARYASELVTVPPPATNLPVVPQAPVVAPPAAAPKIPKLQHHANLWRTRAAWFSAGIAVMGVFGYLRLREEVLASNSDLKARLAAAHADVNLLQQRFKDSDARLAKLEDHRTLVLPEDPSA